MATRNLLALWVLLLSTATVHAQSTDVDKRDERNRLGAKEALREDAPGDWYGTIGDADNFVRLNIHETRTGPGIVLSFLIHGDKFYTYSVTLALDRAEDADTVLTGKISPDRSISLCLTPVEGYLLGEAILESGESGERESYSCIMVREHSVLESHFEESSELDSEGLWALGVSNAAVEDAVDPGETGESK